MTSVPAATRRQRLRTATVREIKDTARRLLVEGGPTAISLRAIAREMGMTAPAIYRYFPSLDGLVQSLVEDLFGELHAVLRAARDDAGDNPAAQLSAMARAFRRWSVAHRPEFGLLFGGPVAGVTAPDRPACRTADAACARVGATFLDSFTALATSHPLRTAPPELVRARLAGHVAPYRQWHGPDLPLELVHTFLSAWIRLYGLVAMEVFGQLEWAVDDAEPLFELELELFMHQLSAADPCRGSAAGRPAATQP
ncbi:MAG TPA: TetR/AcrR family transcriptional regulator [Pilimelia sp.]|nr:TetR/AcrR family transcriptional regulator [Pilimelia sp.]